MICLIHSGILKELDSLSTWSRLGLQRTYQGSLIKLHTLTSFNFRSLGVGPDCLNSLVSFIFFLKIPASMSLQFCVSALNMYPLLLSLLPSPVPTTLLAAVFLCFLYSAWVLGLWWWLTSCWLWGSLLGCVAGQLQLVVVPCG